MRCAIETVLGPAVAAAEHTGTRFTAPIDPTEASAVNQAVPSRREEFSLGRHCARQAMQMLGHAPQPLPVGPHGAPTWPNGLTGSITHCTGYVAAAVARTEQVSAVGIDAEPNVVLPEPVASMALSPIERQQERNLTAWDGSVHWNRLIFSAKESTFKAVAPGSGLDFSDIDVVIGTGHTFQGMVSVEGEGNRGLFHGRWAMLGNVLLTAVVITPRLPWARGEKTASEGDDTVVREATNEGER